MSYLMSKLRTPIAKYGVWVKYGLLMLCASIWMFALFDQLYSSATTMKYLLMSMIIIAIALI